MITITWQMFQKGSQKSLKFFKFNDCFLSVGIEFLGAGGNYNNNNNNTSTNNNNNKKDEDRKHKVYAHNPYNGVVCNDIILATGVFSSKELWKLSKGLYCP